jgi:phage-related protein
MAIKLPIVSSFDPNGLKQAQGALKGFTKQLGGIAVAIGAAFSVRAISNFAKESVLIAEAAATAQARLKAVAEATGVFGAETGKVTDRLAEFAKSQEMRIAVDDKVIKGVQAQLLTFKELSKTADETGGTFDRVTIAAFDMAAAGFGSAESNATALGKALENPIKGVTALARNGTTFTDQQREQIKVLQESGDLLGAQALILAEVESQYGGVAEKTADASARFAILSENIKEQVGDPLLDIFNDLIEDLEPVMVALGDTLGETIKELAPVLKDIGAALPGLMSSLMPLIPIIGNLAGIFFELIAKVLPPFVSLIERLLPMFEQLAPIIADLLIEAFDALIPVFFEIIDALMPIVMALLPVLVDIIRVAAPIVIKLVEAFLPLVDKVLPLMIRFIEFMLPILMRMSDIILRVVVGAVTFLTGAIATAGEGVLAFSDGFVKAFEAVRAFFVGVVNGMIGLFEGFVNGIIGGLNFLIRQINKLKINVPATPFNDAFTMGFDFRELSRITLPKVQLADGGIVTKATRALIGEAGPEAVIPLDKMGGMGNTYNITINANVADSRLGEVVVNAIKRYERTSGPVFASA